MPTITEVLGPELFAACVQNNVREVETLISDLDPTKWWAAVIAAGLEQATDVAAYCLREPYKMGTTNDVLGLVVENESLDPIYRFLVDSNLVEVNHYIDRTGQVLGISAGSMDFGRCSLVKYLLEKGATPNQKVDMYGAMYALTAAAGHRDPEMVELLLDYGAQIKGSGALIYAAQRGNVDNVRYLLTRGADVNEMIPLSTSLPSRADTGSPLHKAVENDHAAIVDILVDAGADVTLRDAQDRTPADIARQKADADMLAKLS